MKKKKMTHSWTFMPFFFFCFPLQQGVQDASKRARKYKLKLCIGNPFCLESINPRDFPVKMPESSNSLQ